MSSQYSLTLARHAPFGAAVIGGGPVGLTTAIGLARSGLSVVVLEKRPPPAIDSRSRPQLLVARRGDLANLHALGVDLRDPRVVAPLASVIRADPTGKRLEVTDVPPIHSVPPPVGDLWQLAAQRPVALVPIVRLQIALATVAEELGVVLRFSARVTRVRRHARQSSIDIDGDVPVLARVVIIATGSARSIAGDVGVFSVETRRSERLLAGGVFAEAGDVGRWVRSEVPVDGVRRLVRATMLQTPAESDAGTALIVEAPAESSPSLLQRCFARAAARHDLGGPMLVTPLTFKTSVVAARHRFVANSNRAPLVLAGDAAQTGHVFAGMNCFVNLHLAMQLTALLGEKRVRNAIDDGRVASGALKAALVAYDKASMVGARVLDAAANGHYAVHAPGDWAMASPRAS